MANDKSDCPKKQKIHKDAKEATDHIDNVLANPALAPNLKDELDLAKANLDSILRDNHKAQ
jgi:hypothetical protein